MRHNARVTLSCGCERSIRGVRKEDIPLLSTTVECLTHGEVTVIHTTSVST